MKHTFFFNIVIRRFPMLALAGMIMVLGACRPVSKGGLPTCSADALQEPQTLRPGDNTDELGIIVDSLIPTLSWTYPDASCNPEYFTLRMDTSLSEIAVRAPIDIRIDGAYRSWIPDSPLNPGETYFWLLFAGAGDDTGSWHEATFRTGPECIVISPGTMSAPILDFPLNGAVVPALNFLLAWYDPTACLPPGDYKVQVDTSPAFTHPFEGSNLMPYLVIGPPWVDFELEDCTRYYWRVKIDLRDRVDSEDGPWSDSWSFTTNESGLCAGLPVTHITPIPPFDFPIPGGVPGGGTSSEPSSWIDGHVWHDLCAVPYASTDIAPPGCIWANDIDGYKANGIYESGEPGLEGVTVDLGAGACPSAGLASDVTDVNGHFSFGPLATGMYCVSINPLSEANISVLIPGTFTFPVLFAEVAEHEITLGDADIRRENNFGWDFQFLPSPSSGAPTAKLLRNANCRKGPGVDYESLTTLFQGLEVPIDGRNPDSSWWWVRIPNSLNHCWLAKENVETSGETGKVPIVEADPLGCWVKGPNDNEAKCVAPCPQGAKPGGACEP